MRNKLIYFIIIAYSLLINYSFSQEIKKVKSTVVTEKIKAIIQKNESFGLKKYPISFWNYTNLKNHSEHINNEAIDEWIDAGFTVPISPWYDPSNTEEVKQFIKLLDYAQQKGIKMIICDPRCYAPKYNQYDENKYKEGIKTAAATTGKHPAVLGFYIGDEPDADNKETFFRCYKLMKEAAPALFPFANLLPYFSWILKRAGTDSWDNYLNEYYNKSKPDMYSYDCYVQMNPGEEGINDYYENLKLYREASLRNGIPFWNTLLSVGHFNYRIPNADDIRWQFNTSIAAGAGGILWYSYYIRQPHDNYRLAPVDEFWEKTQTYYNIRSVQKAFHKRYGDLFTKIVVTRVSFFGKAYGKGELFTPDNIIGEIITNKKNHPLLISEFTDIEGRPYIMIVNNSMTENVNVKILFKGAEVKVYSRNWEGKEVEGNNYFTADPPEKTDKGLYLKHWLAPGQELFYRVEL